MGSYNTCNTFYFLYVLSSIFFSFLSTATHPSKKRIKFSFFTAPRIAIGPHTPEEIDHDVEIMSDGVEETYPMRPNEPDSVSEVSEVSRTNSESETGKKYHNPDKLSDYIYYIKFHWEFMGLFIYGLTHFPKTKV